MYQVLYRKYRPKVFSDVYGQDHVTSTLINEIKENHISHAYLFTGSRGTGKTSCAKILAKAVNCEHNVNGEPCNECEICRGLDAGTIYDVVEIDAASNNGVDNIRDLREEANYMPARGKYRVYIIDEAHMLSTGAFNALLKTLEEPPAHVIFILATTEVHKLPATILSRCQRFDFKRIRPETMAIRLKEVAGFENIKLSDEAAILISRIADGAMRDALSILDQCAGRSKDVDEKLVSEVAGIAGKESLYRLSKAVSGKNSAEALNIISDLYQNSFDMERLCVEMINHFRNFLIVKTVNKSRKLIICTDDEYESIKSGAADYTLPGIIYALDLFQNSLAQIKAGANSRIEMEMSFIKLCEPKLETSVDSLLSRMSELENAVKNGAAVKNTFDSSKNNSNQNSYKMKSESEEKKEAQAPAVEKFSEESKIEDESKSEETENKQPLAESRASTGEAPSNPEKDVQEPFRQWADFMEEIYKKDIALYGVLNGSGGYIRGEYFLIDYKNPALRQFIKIPTHSKAIKQALFDVTGVQYKLGLFKKENENKEVKDPLEDLISKAQGNIQIDIK
ncbi:MAG: DNA polymerase III subunit gamma/tau [Clostridiales bacterium]|nr:DNA polymerase III subunit gamma/tau [Clostridiales bacterium]